MNVEEVKEAEETLGDLIQAAINTYVNKTGVAKVEIELYYNNLLATPGIYHIVRITTTL